MARRWWTNTQKKSVVWKGQDGRKQTAKINTKDAKKKDVANCSMERVSGFTGHGILRQLEAAASLFFGKAAHAERREES